MSTESDADLEALIQRMFQLMSANGALPIGMTIEQAYPFLKGMITADSARRQNIPDQSVDASNNEEAKEHNITFTVTSTLGSVITRFISVIIRFLSSASTAISRI